MKSCQEFLQKLIDSLPEECGVKDLIAAGIYHTRQAAYFGRARNSGPPYILVGGRVVYPKSGVINWINNRNEHVKEEGMANCIHAKAKAKSVSRNVQKGMEVC